MRTVFVRTLAVCLAVAGLTLALPGPQAQSRRTFAGAPADYEDRLAAWQRHLELDAASPFAGLEWRNIGPVVQGGRIVDVESVPGEPYTFYVAYASGGLWRTTNNGVTFEPLFDDQPLLIMGDIAVDPSDPETIWVGTGEHNSSRSSYGGLGVYRSDDAGDTWRSMGLGETDRIGRILVDPRDSRRVFVGSAGKLYTEGGQRGLYRTTDGGTTWDLVLDTGGDGWTGVIDAAFEPGNPDVIYAATWERSRRPWNFVEGGPGSGIWKSTDGGDTWARLTGGLPQGDHVGRIGLAVSPSDPRILYAAVDNQELLPEEDWDLGDAAVTAKRLRTMTVEEFLQQDPEAIEDFIRSSDLDTELDAQSLLDAVETGEILLEDILDELDDANANLFNTDIRGLEVYRSRDGGRTWKRTHDRPIRDVAYTYGYYFGQIRVDPEDPDRIYCLGVPIVTSADGGKTWSGLNGRGVHVDHHELWVDPDNGRRILTGNDGGLDISYDGGASWLKLDRQPVGQFYTVHVDMDQPYNVYGGLQDNGTLKGSSRSRPGLDAWSFIGGGDGMYVQTDSRDGTTYVGFQFGYYQRIDAGGGRSTVRPRDAMGDPALRYNWSTPILLSAHNQDVLYFGANRVYRSLDRGETWTAISDDLTRSPQRGDVPFGTVTTLAESPDVFGQLWAGTDDGMVWFTNDGGVEWRNVSGGLPRDRWVSRVEASPHDADRAYVSLNGYRDDDINAYVYETLNRGRSWSYIGKGLPAEPVNVIREDPVRSGMLYVGTDRGAYVSPDRGATWHGLPGGLPNVPVHDLVIHPRDRELVVGTHGRSIWILDALPIQDLTPEVQQEAVHVFPVEDVSYRRGWRGRRSLWFDRPEDRPELRIPFWTARDGKATLRVLDADERELRRVEQDVQPGVQTIVWDLLLDETAALDAERQRNEADEADDEADDDEATGSARGALADTPWAEAVRLGWPLYVTTGSYTLEIRVGDDRASTELEVTAPRKRSPRTKPKPRIRGRDDD